MWIFNNLAKLRSGLSPGRGLSRAAIYLAPEGPELVEGSPLTSNGCDQIGVPLDVRKAPLFRLVDLGLWRLRRRC